METKQKYFAFISYQRDDEEWAKWLAHELEHYHLPSALNGRDDLPQEFRPIFRDIDELSAGNLPQQIHNALECSKHLIVICSPQSAKSPWVNKEIEEFIRMGKTDKIFPFIIDGIAMCKDPDDPEECFPPALRNLPKDDERLGANVNENGHGNKLRTCNDCPIKEERLKQGDIYDKGRDAAVVKIVAGMLGLSFDTLWQRYEREKAEEERKIREQRDNLLRAQSRFTSKTVLELSRTGDNHLARRLCLEIAPTPKHPDYPYTPEAESALRATMMDNNYIYLGHLQNKDIFTVQFSPDGRTVVSASKDNTVKIWDVATGICHFSITGKSDFHTSASYSPDGKYIAIASRDNFIHIVDSTTGNEIKLLDGQSFIVESIVFSPNGKRLASVSRDDKLQVWDFDKGINIFSFNNTYSFFSPEYNSNRLNSNIFSPDGKYILIPNDEFLQYVDVDENISKVIKDFDGKIKMALFSPNGSCITALSDNNAIYVWDSQTMKRILVYKENGQNIRTVLFAHDDSSLFIYIDNKTENNFCCLDIKTGEITILGNLLFPAQSIYLSNDKIIVAGSIEERLYVKEFSKVRSFKVLSTHLVGVNTIKFNNFGDRIFASSSDKLCVLDSTSGECIQSIEGVGAFSMEIDSSETKAFLIGGRKGDRKLQIWDIQSGKCLRTFCGLDSLDQPIAISKEGKRIATNKGNSFFIWNVYSIKKIKLARHLLSKYGGVDYACFSPDGNMLAIADCTNYFICIWNINKDEVCLEMKGHTSHIISINYSIDGKQIVTTSYDGSIRIWSTDTGSCKQRINYSAEYAEFNNNNSQIISVTIDGKASIWDVVTGMKIQEIEIPVDKASFSSDDKSIVITTADGILIYPVVSYDKLTKLVYERYKKFLLTPEERKKYYLD